MFSSSIEMSEEVKETKEEVPSVVEEVKPAEETELKRKSESGEKKEKKRRRRQYDDAPEEEEEDEEEDDDKLDANFEDDGEDEDDLAEIDTTNIITTGRRTRGKVIDYTKTAEKLQAEGKVGEEEDEEDDGDFKEANETK